MESSSITVHKKVEGIRIENPFTLKVGQVFTGFGIGCGVGIGVGRPLNLGAIPVLNQVMSATRGATDVFSGVGRHINASLRKLGAKNIEAGIGCGVGFGHGFGVGFAVKPGVVNQIQYGVLQAMANIMTRFGIVPNLPAVQGVLPLSLQSGTAPVSETPNQIPTQSIMNLATKVPGHSSQGVCTDKNLNAGSTDKSFASNRTPDSFGSHTEEVINSFMQNPLLKEENGNLNEWGGRLQSENSMIQMVLKHQQVIEELREENMKLQRILVDDLKIPASKLQVGNYTATGDRPVCSDCFECRRKQRKNGGR